MLSSRIKKFGLAMIVAAVLLIVLSSVSYYANPPNLDICYELLAEIETLNEGAEAAMELGMYDKADEFLAGLDLLWAEYESYPQCS